jgi:hypothetical protein
MASTIFMFLIKFLQKYDGFNQYLYLIIDDKELMAQSRGNLKYLISGQNRPSNRPNRLPLVKIVSIPVHKQLTSQKDKSKKM